MVAALDVVGAVDSGSTAFGLSVSGTHGSVWAKLRDGLHLFPSGFPGAEVDGQPARVVAARYLAAVVSLSVTLRVLAGLYTRLGSEMRSRRRHGHSVIVGLGDKGVRIGRALRDEGAKVTGVELQSNGDGAADLRRRGALVLQGDATKTEVLRIARVGRAARVVCACHDDRMNAEIALRVASEVARCAPKHRRVVDVHVHLSDRDLAHAEGPALGLGAVRLQFFNIYELWARALLSASAIEPDGDSGPPFVAVIGAGPIGRAVLTAVGRLWHQSSASARPRVALIDHRAAAAWTVLTARYPALSRVVDCSPVDADVVELGSLELAKCFPEGVTTGCVFVCLNDDADNLRIALQVRQVCHLSSTSSCPHRRGYEGRPARFSGRTRASSPCRTAPIAIHSTFCAMTPARRWRVVHEQYLRTLAAKESSAMADESRPARVPWEELSDDLREANRRHVDHIVASLRTIWFAPAPLYDWDEPSMTLPEEQIDVLAEREHQRWCDELRAGGWRYGAVRNDERREHPLLVTWAQLPEIDRESIASLYGRGRRCCTSPGVAWNRARSARYSPDSLSHNGRGRAAWETLSDDARELNRTSIDDIAVKVGLVGGEIVTADSVSAGEPLVFTAAETEKLAIAEHDRWCRVRTRQGWTYGPVRDDVAKLHPDLVPWAELDEPRRQIDRDHVGCIPHLLATVGFTMTRRVS